MRTVLLTVLAMSVLVIAGAFTFIYAGVFDVSAMRPHWPATSWALETVRVRSIKVAAAGVTPPPGLGGEDQIVGGTQHFAAHCASCHGGPGVPAGNVANGLYPRPADLKDVAKRYTPGELFWILKNGIKMSGMPAWPDHGEDELWNIVAFLERLPAMSEADYATLVVAGMMRGGRHGHGGGQEPKADRMQDHHSMMPGMEHH